MARLVIREATVEDVPALLVLGRAYFDVSGYDRFVVYCPETTAATFQAFIDNPAAALFVAVEEGGKVLGAISGILAPLYFSRETALQQVFWFIAEDCRGSYPLAGGLLARRLLRWGKQQGVGLVVTGALGGDDESKPGKFWRKQGLTPVERQYWGRA